MVSGADYFGQNFREQDSMQYNMMKQGSVSRRFIINQYRVRCRSSYFKLEKRTIGDAFILGHPTNGQLGASPTYPGNQLGEGTMGGWSTIEEDNTIRPITQVGRKQVAAWFNNESPTNPQVLALGVGTTAYVTNQTALFNEQTTFARLNSDYLTYDTATDNRGKFTWVFTPTVVVSGVAEFGMFDQTTLVPSYEFDEDFETGDFSLWNTTSASHFNITQTTVNAGAYASKNDGPGGGSPDYLKATFTATTAKIWGGFHGRLSATTGGSGWPLANMFIVDAAGNQRVHVGLWNDKTFRWNNGGWIYHYTNTTSPSQVRVTKDTWHKVKFWYDPVNNEGKVWYNDEVLDDNKSTTVWAGAVSATSAVTGVWISVNQNSGRYSWVDDVWVATTSTPTGNLGGGNMFYRKVLDNTTTLSTTIQHKVHMWFDFDDDSIGEAKVVTGGLNEIRDWFSDVDASVPTHTEWNDNTTAPAAGDTTLGTTANLSQRNAFENQLRKTDTRVEFESIMATTQLSGTTSQGTTIAKVGQFNDSTAGDLFGAAKIPEFEHKDLFDVFQIDQYNFVE